MGRKDLNIGVATGERSGIFVVDIDGERGEQSLIEITSRFGALPATVEVLTGSAGRHFYFKWPTFEGAPQIRNTASAVAAGIDTRGEGGYVVAPPSLHPSGNRYRWSTSSAKAIADAPVWLLGLIVAPPSVRRTTRRTAAPHIGAASSRTVSRKKARNQTATSFRRQAAARRHIPDGYVYVVGRLERLCVQASAPRSRHCEHRGGVAKTARRRAGEAL